MLGPFCCALILKIPVKNSRSRSLIELKYEGLKFINQPESELAVDIQNSVW